MQDYTKDSALAPIPDNTHIPQAAAAPEIKAESASKKRSKKGSGLKIFLRVLAVIASVLLAIILLLGLTLGMLLGTFSAQLSHEAIDNVIYGTDFNAILSTMGVEHEMAKLYSDAINFISSESTDYYVTLEELLASREFKDFISAAASRLFGAFGEDGFSVSLLSGDIMVFADLLTGPVEQYLGFTLTDDHMDIMKSILDILGIGGKLLTVPLGEFVGAVYLIRFILTDSIRYAVYFLCAVVILLILLLNRKHPLTGTLMCAVPLTLTCITFASFSFTVTLILMLLGIPFGTFVSPILLYTAPPRDYMAEVSLILLAAAIIIMLIPWGIKRIKVIFSKQS